MRKAPSRRMSLRWHFFLTQLNWLEARAADALAAVYSSAAGGSLKLTPLYAFFFDIRGG